MARLQRDVRLLPDLFRRLPAAHREALELLARTAQGHGSELYLVGGSVRDLLLGRGHLDLDFVVEADAPAVARAFHRETRAVVTEHERFRTTTVRLGDLWFDLVTARRESYPQPGDLPVVTRSSLTDDLARRDFTVNAMALAVSGPRRGALIDPYGGRDDLAVGVLRVLHPDGFRDDATRLWRAGRYAARMRLRPDPLTESSIHRDTAFMASISPARVHHELERTLDEEQPERALRLLDRWRVLHATFPGLRCTAVDAPAFPRLRRLHTAEPRAAAAALLAIGLDAGAVTAAASRLDLDRHERAAVTALPALRSTLRRLALRHASPGPAAQALERFPEAALAAAAAHGPRTEMGRMAAAFLNRWRHVRPEMTAARLQEMGVQPGPLMGELLRMLRAARLDGAVASLDDEVRLVQTVIARLDQAPLL